MIVAVHDNTSRPNTVPGVSGVQALPEPRLLHGPYGTVAVRDTSGTGAHPPAGPTLVAVHGWGADSVSNFSALLRAPSRRTVAVDLPGHGASPAPASFSLARCAQILGWVCDELGLEYPVLAGYSMGGPITQLAVLEDHVRPAGLIQIATAARLAPSPLSVAPRSLLRTGTLAVELVRSAAAVLRPSVLQHTGAHGLDLLRSSVRCDPATLVRAARELASHDTRDRLGSLQLPCVSILTTRDLAVPPVAQRELAALLFASVVEVDAGHGLCFEAPFVPAIEHALEILDASL